MPILDGEMKIIMSIVTLAGVVTMVRYPVNPGQDLAHACIVLVSRKQL